MGARRMVSKLLVLLYATLGVVFSSSVAAYAESGLPVAVPGLPDERAYEMVSPVTKGGFAALGYVENVHAAPSGDGFSFFTVGPLPGAVGARETREEYISLRGVDGWSTHGVEPKSSSDSPSSPPEVQSVFPDLSRVFVEAAELAPGGPSGQANIYEQDVATGAYQFFAPNTLRHKFQVAAVTPDDEHFIFEDEEQLLPAAIAGVENLYEWSNGQISLIGELPEGIAATGGSVAGGVGSGFSEYTQPDHALSDDGSRVFFTEPETGTLYVRVNADASDAKTVEIAEDARFQSASPDGSMVFYATGEKRAGSEVRYEKLYVYDVEMGTTTDLVPSGPVGGVLGNGGSDSDAYVYFAAESVLANGAVEGEPNIYVSHYNGVGWTTSYVATLSKEDSFNWATSFETGGGQDRLSRVTPDGKTLLFSSINQVTSYDNAGYNELYLYEAGSSRVSCVSCNPSGESPSGIPTAVDVYLTEGLASPKGAVDGLNGGPTQRAPFFPPHNVADSGSRVFFDTAQALLPQDTNGLTDVYEWERDGAGSCTQTAGCLFLVSSGRGAEGSYFGDASSDGNDVFFFTGQQLVEQDQDELQDVYDARVGAAIVPVIAPACVGTGCQGVPPAPPIFATPSSVTFNGVGNFPAVQVKAKTKTKPNAKKKPKAKKKSRKRKRTGKRGKVGKSTRHGVKRGNG